ncbi:MAG: hypothetical protein EBS06_02345 [Proteobacteria bacterium]|nr:hypothetical protein [Pseudomonadota bacterium]
MEKSGNTIPEIPSTLPKHGLKYQLLLSLVAKKNVTMDPDDFKENISTLDDDNQRQNVIMQWIQNRGNYFSLKSNQDLQYLKELLALLSDDKLRMNTLRQILRLKPDVTERNEAFSKFLENGLIDQETLNKYLADETKPETKITNAELRRIAGWQAPKPYVSPKQGR